MSSMKPSSNKKPRATLNTTINEEVFNEFRTYCSELGYPMNVIIESFMSQFVNGEFVLKIARGNDVYVDLDNI